MLMFLLATILVGLVIGFIAKLLMPGPDPGSGFWATSVLGIAGSIVGSFTGQFLGVYSFGHPAGFIGSVLGAMLLLFIYRVAHKRRVIL